MIASDNQYLSSPMKLPHSFIERFKGKTQLMDKEGHIGVAKRSFVPIEKSNYTSPHKS